VREGQELPEGWAIATVGELTNVGPKNECADATEVGFVPLQRLGITYLSRHTHEPRVWKAVKKGYTQFQNGDVLLARITPSFENGKAGIARDLPNGLGAGSTEYIVFRPLADALDAQYLLAYFKTRSFLTSGEMVMTGAVGQQRVPKAFVLESQLPLAPLNEQRRIAAKINSTLSAVDSCRQRLDGVAAIIKRFRQAVLAAATSGELTREWREERGLEHEWEQSSIDQIAEVGTGSTPLRSNSSFYAAAGTAWITSAATSRELITEASEFVTSEGQAASRLRIYPEGTLLVAMYGEGKTRGQVSELGIPATINQACAAIHAPKDQYLMPFIKIALKANYLKMRSLAEGGNQPNLNLSKIKQFRIGLPPKSEVFEIIDRVESLFTIADQLEAKLTGAHKIVDRLTPALLAKAFRGELVPQDPNDEPASVLLKRIRAARQAEVGAGKPSRRGRRNAHVSLTKPTTLTNMLTRNDVTSNHLTAILKECGPLSAEALWSASQLEIDDFYDQLRDEEAQGLLRENCGDSPNSPRLLEPAA